MLSRLLGLLAVCCILKNAFVYGISTIEISPMLTQTTWATNYVGPLYTVKFTPTTTLDFTWAISTAGSFPESLFLSSTDCATSGVTSGLLPSFYSATCSGAQTTLSVTQPITSMLSIIFTATNVASTGSIGTTLVTEVNPTECQLQQSFSTLISQTSTPCGYNCTATFQCLPGYSTAAGPFYLARCTAHATLDTADPCTVQSSVDTTTATGIPVWGIVLIALGGLAILAACIFVLWKFCDRRPVIGTVA